MSHPEVSVIIPIYNVEQYLVECCESILYQSFENFELILINDGSTDGSYEVARRIKEKDERVILLSQENKGQSAARNLGLQYAKGKYVLFVDSDDWVEKDCLRLLYENMEKYHSDISCCRSQFVSVDGKLSVSRVKSLLCSEGTEILLDALSVKNFTTSPWAKLYNKSFLDKYQLIFKEGIINEDTLFSLQVACMAQKVSYINDVLFDIREREGSTSRSSFQRLFLNMDIALDLAQDFIQKQNRYDKKVENLYKARYLRSTLYNLLQIAQRLPWKEYKKCYVFCLNKTKYLIYSDYKIYLPLKYKIMYCASLFSFSFYCLVRILNKLGFKMH